jgi:hypothetical protein
MSEMGCVSVPTVLAADSGAGTGVDLGIHNYTVVFEFTDSAGRRHLSRSANPFALTLAAAKNVTVSFTYPAVSDHQTVDGSSGVTNPYNWKALVFRTTAGGTQYYLASTQSLVSGSANYIQYTDSMSDATLLAQPIMHRQPGTPNTSLDRYTAPASSCVLRHKDRVFCARGNTVYFSSFDVFGEAPWFNPAFSFNVIGGNGPITALASLEGILVIFKKDAIFVVDGDGPPENGGDGTEFSPPRKLLSAYGCVAANTLVRADDCLMFASSSGIYRLSRKLTVDWVGKNVNNTLSGLYNQLGGTSFYGSAYDPLTHRAIWLIEQYVNAGYALVYDTNTDSWSRYIHRGYGGYGYVMGGVCSAYAGSAYRGIATNYRFVFIGGVENGLYFESGKSDYNGSTTFLVPITLETGWIRSSSKQDRIRVSDFFLAAKRVANTKLVTSYAVDYSPTYVTLDTWPGSATSGLTVVQLDSQPPVESCQSISFQLVTSDPTPTSFGDGSQWDIFGLSVKVGLKGGGVKLPAAQKG